MMLINYPKNGRNIQNLAKVMNLTVKKPKRNANRIRPNKFMPRYIILTLLKTKEKTFKATREKGYIAYRETQIPMTGFLIWNHGGGKEVAQYFQMLKELSITNSTNRNSYENHKNTKEQKKTTLLFKS